MFKIKSLLIFTLFFFLIPNILIGQEITQQDYNRFVFEQDYNRAQQFASNRGAMVTNFKAIGKRKYHVLLYTIISEKTLETTYDYSSEPIFSFEEFVRYETNRREQETRLKIEEERKKKAEEERIKKELDDWIKEELIKRKFLISKRKTDLLNNTLTFIEKCNESSFKSEITDYSTEKATIYINKYFYNNNRSFEPLPNISFPINLLYILIEPNVKMEFNRNKEFFKDSLSYKGKAGSFTLFHKKERIVSGDIIIENGTDFGKHKSQLKIKDFHNLFSIPSFKKFENLGNINDNVYILNDNSQISGYEQQTREFNALYMQIRFLNIIDEWLSDLNIDKIQYQEIFDKLESVLKIAFEVWEYHSEPYGIFLHDILVYNKFKINNKGKYSLSFTRKVNVEQVGYGYQTQNFKITNNVAEIVNQDNKKTIIKY